MANPYNQVLRIPEFIYSHAETEARASGRRTPDVLGQWLRLGLEQYERSKAEVTKAREVIASLKAI